jgi:hypothetical protein
MQALSSGCVITEEQKMTYAGMYVLKRMDLDPKEGGVTMPVVLPSELSPLEEVLHELAIAGYIDINRRKERYDITKQGFAYIGTLIDEAEAYIEEFDDEEVEDMIAALEQRNLDVFRVRFLWGWYQGELDDLVLFQERRGVQPVERMWAFYLMSDELYDNLALDITAGAGD